MGLSLITKLKLLGQLNSTANAVEEGIAMKNSTKIVTALIALITGVLQIPAIQLAVTGFLGAHPAWATAIGGIVAILALLHVPVDTTATKVLAFFVLLFTVCSLQAQTVSDPANIYGAGVSYNAGAAPAIAGTGLYAHLVNNSSTYAFTAVDLLPNTVKPLTVTTNIGAGIGQKIATIGKVPIYIPTAAGISFNGSNTGWQWNTGALVSIHLKNEWYLMPTVRVVKSSVSNGTGYQPIVGVLFSWAK